MQKCQGSTPLKPNAALQSSGVALTQHEGKWESLAFQTPKNNPVIFNQNIQELTQTQRTVSR